VVQTTSLVDETHPLVRESLERIRLGNIDRVVHDARDHEVTVLGARVLIWRDSLSFLNGQGCQGLIFARACLLIADVVVDDDGGQGDAAEVGQGVFDAPMDVKRLIEPWVQLWCW